jgi:TnpA family transposase
MARLSILSDEEIEDLYGIPKFDDEDRRELFTLDSRDQRYVKGLKDPASRINYVLQLGYFRDSQYFFSFSLQKVREDAWFVIHNLFPGEPFPKKACSRYQHYQNQERIRKNNGFSTCSDAVESRQILPLAEELARKDVFQRFIFEEIIKYCRRKKIVRPGYSTLQDIISKALKSERHRLSVKLARHLNPRIRKSLDELLTNEETFHRITFLKKDAKDFTYNEVKKVVRKRGWLVSVYEPARKVVPELGISRKNIRYYASLAQFYPVAKLKRMHKSAAQQKAAVRLYLLCYVYDRVYQVNDYMVSAFFYTVSKFEQNGDKYKIEQILNAKGQDTENRKRAGRMLLLYKDADTPDEELRPRAFQIVAEDKIEDFARRLQKPSFDEKAFVWDFYESQSRAIKLNLRPIFLSIDFSCDQKPHLRDAVEFFRKHISRRNSRPHRRPPIDFVPPSLRKYLYKRKGAGKGSRQKELSMERYEFMLYLQLRNALDSGTVFVRESFNYNSLEGELIREEIWNDPKKKKELLLQLNNPVLLEPIGKLFDLFDQTLTKSYREVNERIASGQNKHIVIQRTKKDVVRWKLPYRRQEDSVNNPFYENIPTASIGDVMSFVEERTGFLEKFVHIQPRYTKKEKDPDCLLASLIARATGTGIEKMIHMCDLSPHAVRTTDRGFLYLENLRSVNDHVVNETAKLPIFSHYSLSDYGIHASIDGQKMETKYKTFKARYSRKYFGRKVGVVILSLLANHLAINTKVIGANEHESHFLFDLVYNNTSDVDVHSVSGDMHSVNRVNFAILYLFGYRFMPRFTKFDERARDSLVSFQNPKAYEGFTIRPIRKADRKLMETEWDNFLRIVASLASKETTQAVIIRKLSSYKRVNQTLKALIEFDQLLMTLYMLEIIDDPEVITVVHRSLNRIESFHQLKSAIAKTAGKKIAGRTELELAINNECATLLANCIVFYNSAILSSLLAHYEERNDEEGAALVKRFSPVAFQHINLIGKYEFLTNRKIIDLQALTEFLTGGPENR